MLKYKLEQVFTGVLLVSLNDQWQETDEQQLTETILNRIKDTNPSVAILDISFIKNIDIPIIRQLAEIIDEIQLLDTRVILTGVNSSVKRLLAHLDIGLPEVTTCQFLAEGLWAVLDILESPIK